jgi:hypothetical protein
LENGHLEGQERYEIVHLMMMMMVVVVVVVMMMTTTTMG